MTYEGAMVLPQNAVVMHEEEMRYLEGGKTWTKNMTVRTPKHKYLYRITIKDLKAWQTQLLETAGLTAIFLGSCASAPTVGAIAVAVGSAVCLSISIGKLKSMISIKKIKTYF